MKIVFSEGSGLNDSVYGKCQAPIRMFLEQRGEQFEQQSVLKDLFLMGTSDNYGDMLTTMTAMSGFEPVGENGAYPADGMQEGYRKLLVYDTWKDSFAISAEMIEDSKLMDLKKQPAAFLTGYNRTREMFGAALLGNAIRGNAAAQYHGKSFDINAADGVTLFHTAHPPKVAGDNQCNSFKDEFSVDALGKLETAMHLFRGDNDEILDVAPDTIVIPENADLKKAVFTAIGADKDPVTANNAFNYQYGRWTVIVWSYLNQFITAGTKPWLLLDSKYNKTYGGAVWNDRIQLAPMMEEILTDLAPLAEKNGITLACDGDGAMTGSDGLIYRLLFNLTENAIKYNHPGGTVRLTVQEEAARLVIRVADTGCGIPEPYRESIFQPFFRVDKSRSREYGGVGLGLSLVWAIVELHGGSVCVEDSSEAGTTIAVQLPVQ